MLKITKMLFLAVLVIAFQSCSDDDSTSTGSSNGGDTVTAPSTFVFTDDSGASTVSYSGQVVRQMLIGEIKSQIGAGTATEAGLLSLYENDDAAATYNSTTTTFQSVSTSKLSNKISGATTVEGYTSGPDALVKSWFAAAEGVKVADDGVNLDQMVGKGLLGMVGYYQGTSVYMPRIDQMNSAGTAYEYSNVDIVDDKTYTAVEHYWDESFGYFGAARDYGTQTNSERQSGGSSTEYTSAVNWEWAKYAAKRSDCTGCDTGEFDTKIMDAYLLGRALISAGADRSEIAAQREIIVTEWEKVVAANVVHYANDVANLIAEGGDSYDCSANTTCNKYWSEMRAFGLCMQFNTAYSTFASSSDFTTMISNMLNAPPTASNSAAFVSGVATTNAAFKTHFGFTDNDIDATNGF